MITWQASATNIYRLALVAAVTGLPVVSGVRADGTFFIGLAIPRAGRVE